MKRQSILYFIAAGLFAIAAGISISRTGDFSLGVILQLLAAAAFAFVGIRTRKSEAG